MRHTRKDIFGPFRVALTGLVFTFKTQRHMRFHLYVVLTVVLLGLLINLPLREMLTKLRLRVRPEWLAVDQDVNALRHR